MKTCYIALRSDIHYRIESFKAGFERLGYKVVVGATYDVPDPSDVLVIWNRYHPFHQIALNFERVGAIVLVVENGYLGKRWIGREWFAISRGRHNGAGRVPFLGPSRWASFGQTIRPYRGLQGPVVLLPQRGIGEASVAMPRDWTGTAAAILKGHGFDNVRVRTHPGKIKNEDDVIDDLVRSNARGVFTWGSGAALKAMLHGFVCVSNFPLWIGLSGTGTIGDLRSGTAMKDRRQEMFERLAWAQWTLDEVEHGDALWHLISL